MSPEQDPFLDQEQQFEPNDTEQTFSNPIRNFLIGAFFGGLPIFVYFSLSVWMTHASLAEVGSVKLAVAIAVPILCGLLSVIFGKRAIKVLTDLSDVNLPF